MTPPCLKPRCQELVRARAGIAGTCGWVIDHQGGEESWSDGTCGWVIDHQWAEESWSDGTCGRMIDHQGAEESWSAIRLLCATSLRRDMVCVAGVAAPVFRASLVGLITSL